MESLIADHKKMMAKASLSSSLDDVDRAIQHLKNARAQIDASPNDAPLVLARLQNPVKSSFDAVKKDLKEVNDVVNKFSKSLDKKFTKPFPNLPYGTNPEQSELIGRAIGMHLLREGHFSVASTFLDECFDSDQEQRMEEDGMPQHKKSADQDLEKLRSEGLRVNFAEMYRILDEMRSHNLGPATEWAQLHRSELEARGSNLEFELARLNYVWIFAGISEESSIEEIRARQQHAMAYARKTFGDFQGRYLREVQQLIGAMAFCENLKNSPYRQFFSNESAWDELTMSFTREFCSLMGLSAESPVYLAATAGTIALPKLLKLQNIMETKHTEWTSQGELPVEIPLPPAYRFHSIFVCPVSKEQTTDDNPPMMMPCGHVIAQQSLHKISKVSKFKCPYCPSESHPKDARKITL